MPIPLLRSLLPAAAVATLLGACGSSGARSRTTGADSAAIGRLEANIQDRVASGRATMIVAGVLLPDGSTKMLSAGTDDAGRTPDGDTVFEIGSITKVFTATLLSDMVVRREVRLDEPVGSLLPEWKLRARRRPIRLVDLATQSSGLPRELPSTGDADPANPWKTITAEEVKAYVEAAKPAAAPGARYEYSNVGFALLGEALAHRSKLPYERLLADRILGPLGMSSTGITLAGEMERRLVVGHTSAGAPVPPVAMDAIAPAGALRSSTNDLLRFAAASVAAGGPLREAMDQAMAPRADATPGMRIGLAWHVASGPGGTFTWHNGGTIGFRSFMAIDRIRRTAVIVWTNAARDVVDDIGFNYLDPNAPLIPPPKQRTAVTLPASILDRYVGEYRLPGLAVRIDRGSDGLVAKATGQPSTSLSAESETEFFLREVDAQVTFNVRPDGTVTGLVLHQGGVDVPGKKTR